MTSYKLYYFDARGRAEVARLIFTLSGQPFEDIRIAMEEWPEFKKKNTPFGQIPVLEIDGIRYGQSSAINNYLARKFGLYGKTDEEAFAIDRISALITDFHDAAKKGMFEQDATKKAELMKQFATEAVPKYLGILERLLKDNGNGHFAGSTLTLADLIVYDSMWGMKQRQPTILDNYPTIQAFVDKIGAIPKIKTYVEARKLTPF